MDIQTTKLEIMHLLLQTQKESLLSKIKEIFDNEQADWWDEMSKSEQEEIEVGLLQANKEEYVSHTAVMKHFDKCL